MKSNQNTGGLAFLTAARDLMPRTLGDRDRIRGMSEAMNVAIRCRFCFALTDAEALAKGRFGIKTCVGVFRPLDYYAMACKFGGTYARMWEVHTGMQPWIAPLVLLTRDRDDSLEPSPNNRVAVGLGVLIATPVDQDDEKLARTRDHAVWWCTSVSNDQIILCRYRYPPDRRWPGQRDGAPAKRWTLSRDEWKALMDPPLTSADEAVAQGAAT